MIGQDAVRSAGEFHRRLGLTGVILTKLDGDARGGAALSIGKVTGAPVKFVGVGEKYDALEAFYPERIVSRVLGMGDMLSLIERAEQTIDHKKAAELERKLRRSEFTLEDFRDQLRQVRKMGPLEQVLGMLPKVGPLANLPKDAHVDESRLKHIEAIINSMTAAERDDHDLIDGKRRKRIARGSGTSVQEVNQVLKQYLQMRTMMKQYGALAAQGRLRGLGKRQADALAEGAETAGARRPCEKNEAPRPDASEDRPQSRRCAWPEQRSGAPLSRPRMGRAAQERPQALRIPGPGRHAGRTELGDHPPQARRISRGASTASIRSRSPATTSARFKRCWPIPASSAIA